MSGIIAIKFNNKNNKVHFVSSHDIVVEENQKIVCTTTRGVELATVVKTQISKDEISPFVVSVNKIASPKDISDFENNKAKAQQLMEKAKDIASKCRLNINITESELTLPGNKIILTYISDDRIDFREFVKTLATELKLKIELKQINTRDNAQSLGGIGSCGQVLCCKRYLSNFDKVSIKMAKTQNLSLIPTKINGICNKLMCCLSFENDAYEQYIREMPKVNQTVGTPDGNGVVVYQDLLKQISTIKFYDKEKDGFIYKSYPLAELTFNKPDTLPCGQKIPPKINQSKG